MKRFTAACLRYSYHTQRADRRTILAKARIALEGAVMNRQVTIMLSAAVAIALAVTIATGARADDSSIGRFSDGYAYFNQITPISKSASTFRQSNPQGLSTIELEALSSGGPAWHPAPAVDKPTGSMPKRPKGLSESEVQGPPANSSRWQIPAPSPASAYASTMAIRFSRDVEK